MVTRLKFMVTGLKWSHPHSPGAVWAAAAAAGSLAIKETAGDGRMKV